MMKSLILESNFLFLDSPLVTNSLIFIAGFIFGLFIIKLKEKVKITILEERIKNKNDLIEDLEKKTKASSVLYENLQKKNLELSKLLASKEASFKEQNKSLKEQIELIKSMEINLKTSFDSLSLNALKENNNTFLKLAKETLNKYQTEAKNDLEKKENAINHLVKPIETSLENVNTQIKGIEKERENAYATIKEQLRSLSLDQIRLREETSNLVKALRTPHVRGRWGEIQLKKVVEISGMLNYCDFVEQKSLLSDESKILRPDMIINLPNKKNIIIDSKAPLEAYLDSLEAKTEEDKIKNLTKHAKQIKTHLIKLSEKSYWAEFSDTPEFVVLFLPGEAFFSAALEKDSSLIEFGVKRGVILATPTTLIALLKAIAYGWKEQSLTNNAKKISELGKELYKRTRTLGAHFIELKKGLDKSINAYNKSVSSFESRVLVSARKFKDLGASDEYQIEELESIDKNTKEIKRETLG